MRTDVVDALKEMKIPVLRWPGGCFADEYHWMDGVGPKESRKKMINIWQILILAVLLWLSFEEGEDSNVFSVGFHSGSLVYPYQTQDSAKPNIKLSLVASL